MREEVLSRFESVGISLPKKRLSSKKLMDSCSHLVKLDLEKHTGIQERRICSDEEDSYSLAVDAARDCLSYSRFDPLDIDILINCSITKYDKDLNYQFDPPLSLFVRESIGAKNALYFDVMNACAGMFTGIYILDNYIRHGIIKQGMVVSGEYASSIAYNASQEAQSIFSKQIASLTVGDSGAALIMERAEDSAPGITACEFATYSNHSDLCIGKPSENAPGASMFTNSRKLHHAAIESSFSTTLAALKKNGVSIQDIDWLIPHQTSTRAIRSGTKSLKATLGGTPKNIVNNLKKFGNTASTSIFIALHKLLKEQRLLPGEKILLQAFASGVVCGCVIFTMDELCQKYI